MDCIAKCGGRSLVGAGVGTTVTVGTTGEAALPPFDRVVATSADKEGLRGRLGTLGRVELVGWWLFSLLCVWDRFRRDRV